MKKDQVTRTTEERQQLQGWIATGKGAATKLTHPASSSTPRPPKAPGLR
jgi:hypothetical protein